MLNADGNFPLWLAPDQGRVSTCFGYEVWMDYAKLIVAELRANRVRVNADFRATPFKAKLSIARRSPDARPKAEHLD